MTKLNSNRHKSNPSIKTDIRGKTIRPNSTTDGFVGKSETKNPMSESDQLTLRAWKKTFENRKKVVRCP